MSSSSDSVEEPKKNLVQRLVGAIDSRINPRSSPTLAFSYKPPYQSQVTQVERGEAWWRDFQWEEYATKFIPGLGLGFTVYPYVAIWEKVWGAVPTEDYQKYKQLYTQEPFIRATIDLHTFNVVGAGFELDYPIPEVVKDLTEFLKRHDWQNLEKIMVREHLIFGNSYTEIVRTWMCPQTGHDLEALRISYELETTPEKPGFWWTDRMDVADRHNKLYPDHKLANPYGEIERLKPLDPMYMRVRRDAFGTILGYIQYYVFPLVTFLADEIFHLRYVPSSWTYESVYGNSMLRPILFHEELTQNYEQIMGQIINVYLKPMFIIKVGGTMPGQEVTQDQFLAVQRAFATRKPGSDIVVKATAPVELTPVNPPIDRMQTTAFWLDWLHKMRTYALSVPKFFSDPEGLNKATAIIAQESYWTFINSIRVAINAQLEQALFPMILRSIYGEAADQLMKEFGVPKIVWKPVRQESLQTKAEVYTSLYGSRIIKLNEARIGLGFKPLQKEEIDELLAEATGSATGRSPPLPPSGEGLEELIGEDLTTESEGMGAPEGEGVPEEGAGEGAPEGGQAPLTEEKDTRRLKMLEEAVEDAEEEMTKIKARAGKKYVTFEDIAKQTTNLQKAISETQKRMNEA